MLVSYTAQIALDLATERVLEGERRARLLAGAGPDFNQPSRLRRGLARVAQQVSREAADIARRLDGSAVAGPI